MTNNKMNNLIDYINEALKITKDSKISNGFIDAIMYAAVQCTDIKSASELRIGKENYKNIKSVVGEYYHNVLENSQNKLNIYISRKDIPEAGLNKIEQHNVNVIKNIIHNKDVNIYTLSYTGLRQKRSNLLNNIDGNIRTKEHKIDGWIIFTCGPLLSIEDKLINWLTIVIPEEEDK